MTGGTEVPVPAVGTMPADTRWAPFERGLCEPVAEVRAVAAAAADRHQAIAARYVEADRADRHTVDGYLHDVTDEVVTWVASELERLADPVDAAVAALRATGVRGAPDAAAENAWQSPVTAAYRELERTLGLLELAVTEWLEQGFAVSRDVDAPAAYEPAPAPLAFTAVAGTDAADEDSPEDTHPDFGAAGVAFEDRLRTLATAPAPEWTVPSSADLWWEDGDEPWPFDAWWSRRRTRFAERRTEVLNRLSLCRTLVGLRGAIHDHAGRLLAGVWEDAVGPANHGLRSAGTLLDAAIPEVTRVLTDAALPGGAEEELRREAQTLASALERELGQVTAVAAAEDPVAVRGEVVWESLLETVSSLPEDVAVHAVRDDGSMTADMRLDLREAARDALSPPWPQQLREAGTALHRRLVQVGNELDQIGEILEYHLHSAAEEIRRAASDGDESAARTAAQEVAVDGLRRAAERALKLADAVAPEWRALAAATYEAVQDDWSALERRTQVRDQMRERLVGYETRLVRWLEHAWDLLGRIASGAWDAVQRWARILNRRVRLLVRRGGSAVGVGDAKLTDAAVELAAIRSAEHVLERLPRVYRRLFTLDPLTESTLVEGRSRDLVRVRNHLLEWQEGREDRPLIITGAPGSGRTTFLNMIEDRVVEDQPVRRYALAGRAASVDDAAALLTRAWDEHHAPLSAAAFAATVNAGPGRICLIDNAEHLVFQAFGQRAVTTAVLELCAATGGSVLWIFMMSEGAWHYVDRAIPEAARLASHVPLTPIDRDLIKTILTGRHERTGMPIRFVAPERTGAWLRQRLRRARTEERRQELLRASYFDQMARAVDQSIGLALVYWLRAANFDADPDVLVMPPIRPVGTTFLEALPVDLQFALRAIVVHGSISVAELAAVLRASEATAISMIRSLEGIGVVEPMPADPETARYRVVPLVRAPVTAFLRRGRLIYH